MTANHPTEVWTGTNGDPWPPTWAATERPAPPTTLQPVGVAMLLFRDDRTLTVPNVEQDRPGIRCTAHHDQVLMEAVGWPSVQAASNAINRASQVCLDAGLLVSFTGIGIYPARLVRRRPR
jgi:hypothetical protein